MVSKQILFKFEFYSHSINSYFLFFFKKIILHVVPILPTISH